MARQGATVEPALAVEDTALDTLGSGPDGKLDKLDLILGAVTSLRQQNDDLTRRLAATEEKLRQQDLRTVKFEPIKPAGAYEQQTKTPHPDLSGLTKAGQTVNGSQNMPMTASGQVMPYVQPSYPKGTIVKFNPTSEIYGLLRSAFEKRKGRFDPATGEGVVIDTHFINRDFRWKLRVQFVGLTKERGDGFWEDELIPA